jgi:autotransporter-associated beta strand protein
MKFKSYIYWKKAAAGIAAFTLVLATQSQTVTNPVPNLIISWSFNQYGFVNAAGGSGVPVPNTEAGLAAAYNWNDSWSENYSAYPYGNAVTVTNLFDNTGTATATSLSYNSYNGYSVSSPNPAQDANGTYNRDMLNGFLNAGPASWNPPTTNSSVLLTNIPYAQYDVVVYFNSDTSGRHASIDNGATDYYFSTMGSPSVNGANALLVPTAQTNSAVFPSADFAFFLGMTNASAKFTATSKSGNDQWLGIAAFQVIQSSNAYVLYGPSPTSQIVPVGQPAAFSVMAGGLNPAYQWQHGGTNILNATNATYAIAATAIGQDGNYGVIVSNGFGSVTSVVATLTFYAPKTVEWDGNGSTWDTSSDFWTINGGASTTNYTETDNVRFGPLGSAESSITLASTFVPGSVTVSNASYTLTAGGIGGSGSMHVMNNGTLILDTADTSSGPTWIDSGSTLQLDNADTSGSLGSGTLTNNGALVFNANNSTAYGYPIYGSGSITNFSSAGTVTLGNNVNGNFLVQGGSGVLLLQGNNSLTGGLVVSSGTVWARSLGALGNAPVVVSGGELQLIYSSDFVAPSMTLSGGVLHGVGGDSLFEGIVSLAADTQINVDGGSILTLNNVAGISGSSYNLTFGDGAGTLVLVGTNNTWGSVTINTGTLQIGNGGGGSLGGGAVTSLGAIAFDVAGNMTVTNPFTGSGSLLQIGTGTLSFTGDLSALTGGVTASSGGLGGVTTIGAPVSVLPGATLTPGTPSTIGTLTLNNGLTLGGNLSVKVNKSLAQPNDLVVVTGALSDTNSGTLLVSNLGPALNVGDIFTLFNQAVTGGTNFAVTGGGVIWSNNLANDGSIIVISKLSRPVIQKLSLGGGSLIVSGANGLANDTCFLLTSTNVTTPLPNWTRISTNAYDASGNVSITNAIPAGRQNYYLLESQ